LADVSQDRCGAPAVGSVKIAAGVTPGHPHDASRERISSNEDWHHWCWQIGGTLTRRLTALGHEVFVANSRGPETLSDLAADTGATAVSVPEAVHGVDLVVVTIPEKNIPLLPAGLFADTPGHVVVVDTGNYYPRQRDGRIEAIEEGLPESQWVAQQLARPMIKAFNNIYARHLLELGRPKGATGRIALPVSGDDEAAKAYEAAKAIVLRP
jgi:8-hydroxy-5-deazaflavin:NADPH oxidoreductase